MKMNSLFKQVTVALNFPTVISKFIVFAKAILLAMTNNPNFKDSSAKVTKLGADVKVLDDAETACRTKPPTGTIEARNAALQAVKSDLKSLRNDVQEAADADPENALAIIASANMSVKNSATHSKQQNAAEVGVEDGTIVLTGEGAGAHEWRVSNDEIEWVYITPSFTSKTIATDLSSNTNYYCQNRKMLRNNKKGEWSQSIKIRTR